jgi:hypothetical protein
MEPTVTRSKGEQQTGLLVTILSFRAAVGEGVSDDEFSWLLRARSVPAEAGFAFLNYSAGFALLSVPPQNPVDWYPQKGWITAEKERVAQGIAEKHGFSVFEPVDTCVGFCPTNGSPPARHHVEFSDRRQTLVVAHPQYLKVRLYGRSPDHRYEWESMSPIAFDPDLLGDLATLYRPAAA